MSLLCASFFMQFLCYTFTAAVHKVRHKDRHLHIMWPAFLSMVVFHMILVFNIATANCVMVVNVE